METTSMKHAFRAVALTAALFIGILSIHKVEAAGTFSISPTSGNFIRSCTQTAKVMINVTSGQSNAADIILTYDPNKIEILDSNPAVPGIQIQSGIAFDSYAGNTVNTTSGEIKLVGFSATSQLTGNATFATISYRSKPTATSAGFTFTFTGADPYNTLDTNIADSVTSYDMLSSVSNSSYTFSAGSCASDVTPPSITFVSPVNLATNVAPNTPVTITVADAGSGVDLSSVVVIINGVSYTQLSPEMTVSGNPSSYSITITPSNPFSTTSLSVISVVAQDTAGNSANSNITINAKYSCPVTYVNVPGNCPATPSTPTPTPYVDRQSPVIAVSTTTIISVTKNSTITVVATDNDGILPESFLLTLGGKTFTLASTPTSIVVSGSKTSYTFVISLVTSELKINSDGTLSGITKITDINGNTRIENIILKTDAKPSNGSISSTQTTWQEAIGKTIIFDFLPATVGITLLLFAILSMQPTIAIAVNTKKKGIRFPTAYLLHSNGTTQQVWGGIDGKIHGRLPRETVTLVIQKYGYTTVSRELKPALHHTIPEITLQRVQKLSSGMTPNTPRELTIFNSAKRSIK